MKTPLWDFLRRYAEDNPLRLHMPAHKGVGDIGVEPWDITEIEGMDPLYSGRGVLRESQRNAASLFGSAETLYSVEGSSLCIRAMVALLVQFARKKGVRPLLLATRNVHSAFLSAVACARAEVDWLYADAQDYTACPITAKEVEDKLDAMEQPPVALYVTSPDYLGNRQPIDALAALCQRRGVLLAVDNAHGAYLHFADGSHPLDLGADICCDSAHKTLPALTPCAYLHISQGAPAFLAENALAAMRLFATTSPGFVQLASLDRLNATLDGYAPIAQAYSDEVRAAKQEIRRLGYDLVGDEPYKITLDVARYGYRGEEFAALLRRQAIEVEMASDRYVVAMLSPSLSKGALRRLVGVLASIDRRQAIEFPSRPLCRARVAMPLWLAVWSNRVTLPLDQCVGRVAADVPCHCPPEVPAVMPGEWIDEPIAALLSSLGVENLSVVE